ncbi:MAG: hypothetical protein ACFFC3_02145 [Candidatus Odinarchaeota archaeon]
MKELNNNINSKQYIEELVQDKNLKDKVLVQKEKLITSIKIGFKTFFYSKKWLIYIALAFLMLPVTILTQTISEGESLKFENPDEAFINTIFGMQLLYPVIFIFGCILLILPLSADEISEHSTELYLVRPIKRETYWLSRWIIANVIVYFVNIVIYFIYFLFIHAFAAEGVFAGLGENLDIFTGIAIFLLLATLIYSGIFLAVGMIGNRGMLLMFTVAIFELFIISIIFLSDSPFIPQNNLYKIANDLLPDHLDLIVPEDLELNFARIYVTILPIAIFFIGAFYLRMRQFK